MVIIEHDWEQRFTACQIRLDRPLARSLRLKFWTTLMLECEEPGTSGLQRSASRVSGGRRAPIGMRTERTLISEALRCGPNHSKT
jgi:hypothetical protein